MVDDGVVEHHGTAHLRHHDHRVFEDEYVPSVHLHVPPGVIACRYLRLSGKNLCIRHCLYVLFVYEHMSCSYALICSYAWGGHREG